MVDCVKFEPTEQMRYSVELMAGIGVEHNSISDALGICEKTLCEHFSEELRNGKTKIMCKVADSVVRQALAGNMTAAIFYLKTQCGWRERDPIAEIKGKKAKSDCAPMVTQSAAGWDSLLVNNPTQ